MRIAIVVVSWNGEAHLDRCLGSVFGPAREQRVVVVDNNSGDRSLEIARQYPLTLVQNPENRGFAPAANQGMAIALELSPAPNAVLLLNQDAWLEDGSLNSLAEGLHQRPEAGILGCLLLYPGEPRIQHAGGILERPRMCGHHTDHRSIWTGARARGAQPVDFVTGAAMCIRSETLHEVGLFDEVFSPGYYEDVDLCLRAAAAGWEILMWPQAVVRHFESASFSNRDQRLVLSHRNRYLLALQFSPEPGFVADFEDAESRFLRSQASEEELRALGKALAFLLRDLVEFCRASPRLRELPGSAIRDFAAAAARLRNLAMERLLS